jgi:hypothetical protein
MNAGLQVCPAAFPSVPEKSSNSLKRIKQKEKKERERES